MDNVRLRRLKADHDALRRLAHMHPKVEIEGVFGNPPERYRLRLKVKSLRERGESIETVTEHRLEVTMPRGYPRDAPLFRMLTPVFHPNIAPHAVCIGDDWTAGESIDHLIQRVGEILAYQSYNTKSPLNGEAARWTDENLDRLPLDSVRMDVEETGAAPPAPPIPTVVPLAQPAPPPAVQPVSSGGVTQLTCPGCSARLRAFGEVHGKRFRCSRCQTEFSLPARTAPL